MNTINQNLVTKIIRGDKVSQLIRTPGFQDKWEEIRLKANTISVLQSKPFVETWYRCYCIDFEPIACVCYNDKEVVGLMFLAFHKHKKNLVHAGAHEAEYHGWLSLPDVEIEFLHQSFKLLKKQFKLSRWDWQWMPPSTNIEVIKSALPKGMSIVLTKEESPNWDLSKMDKLEKLLRSKSLKSKMRRFQKRGTVVFEVIESSERLKVVLDQVKNQYDFRQEGAYGAAAFENDPNKENFTLELYRAGVVHASALLLNDKVLAFHLGCKDDKRVCLGLISFNPIESKNSPGTLLIVELAKHLNQNGYHHFDLTPVANSYKNRFANDYQTIYRPSVYFNDSVTNISDKLIKKCFVWLHKRMYNTGIKTATLRDIKNNINELPRNFSVKTNEYNLWQLLKKLVYQRQQLRIYRIGRTNSLSNESNDMYHQKFEHMLLYSDHQPFLQRRKLLQNALSKFSNEAEFYSILEDQELIWYGWHLNTKKPLCLIDWPKPFQLKPGMVIGDFYQNSKFSKAEMFSKNVEKMLQAIPKLKNQETYLILRNNQCLKPSIIEEWDIQPIDKKVWVRLFYLINWVT